MNIKLLFIIITSLCLQSCGYAEYEEKNRLDCVVAVIKDQKDKIPIENRKQAECLINLLCGLDRNDSQKVIKGLRDKHNKTEAIKKAWGDK